jgi:hypothetical protein
MRVRCRQNVFTELVYKRHWYICLSRGRCIVTAQHATSCICCGFATCVSYDGVSPHRSRMERASNVGQVWRRELRKFSATRAPARSWSRRTLLMLLRRSWDWHFNSAPLHADTSHDQPVASVRVCRHLAGTQTFTELHGVTARSSHLL